MNKKILSDITIYTKYAKYKPELERRETWDELVNRNMEMHIKKYPKDTKAGRYLTRLLDQRRHMLNYLVERDYHRYKWICTDYGIPEIHAKAIAIIMLSYFKVKQFVYLPFH